jgi:HSP20 family molecular chaperone IbpA
LSTANRCAKNFFHRFFFQEMNMKAAILKPSLLALALTMPMAASHADDSTAKQPAKQTPKAEATAKGDAVNQNPWNDFMRMQAEMMREMNAMNASMWMPMMLTPPIAFAPTMVFPPAPASFAMPTVQSSGVKRTDTGYQLQLRLPGYKPEDIRVRLDGQLLTVSAESSSDRTVKMGQQSEQSQSSHTYAEAITLPGPVQASGLKESYKDGVLTITVPSRKSDNGSA